MSITAKPAELKPVTLITGATRGIGREIASLAAEDGHALWLIGRNQVKLEGHAEQLRHDHNVKVTVQALDLAQQDSVDAIEAGVADANCYVKFLINCAGAGLSGPFVHHDRTDLMRLCDLNMRALTGLCHRFLPDMLARRGGGILNVASLGGFLPGPYQAAYYASKSYVISLTRAMAHENIGSGVRFSVLLPGPVSTDFHKDMGAESAFYTKLLPLMSPASVARTGYGHFMCGERLIVPGPFNMLFGLALAFLPGFIMIPILGWLLKRRRLKFW